MKKIFILYLLFSLAFLQAQHTSNRFAEAEVEDQALSMSSTMSDPAHPPQYDPDALEAPIDDYIPLLLITAIGLILFYQKRQQQLKPSV